MNVHKSSRYFARHLDLRKLGNSSRAKQMMTWKSRKLQQPILKSSRLIMAAPFRIFGRAQILSSMTSIATSSINFNNLKKRLRSVMAFLWPSAQSSDLDLCSTVGARKWAEWSPLFTLTIFASSARDTLKRTRSHEIMIETLGGCM